MAITSSAKKANRASARKRIFNVRRKQAVDATLKSIQRLVKSGKASDAKKLLPAAYKALDKAAKTNYLKKNTAARLKSRITLLVNKVSSRK
ncbi:MAG TPA: 30S ribosomal protein S20 [Candidatus Paceibacterota bacterium]